MASTKPAMRIPFEAVAVSDLPDGLASKILTAYVLPVLKGGNAHDDTPDSTNQTSEHESPATTHGARNSAHHS